MRRFELLFPIGLVAVAAQGCFASVRLDEPAATPRHPGHALTVAVVPANAEAPFATETVEEATHDLLATGLFERLEAAHSSPDLTVIVRTAGGAGRCGNPLLPSLLTLGLLPGRTAYFHRYDLDFVARSGERLTFDRHYEGVELFGIWALPARVSPRWSRMPRQQAPPVVVQRLRADLASSLAELIPTLDH